jgi:hypothetical protein
MSEILGAKLTNDDYVHEQESETRVFGSGKRGYQLDILKAFEGSSFNMLTKPSGSGKSFEQATLAIKDIEATGRKQLILVPQVHISDGFFPEGETRFQIAGEEKEYKARVLPEYNFCKQSSIRRLAAWLLTENAELAKSCGPENLAGGLVAMTSYVAFVHAFKKMTHAEKVAALSHIHIRPDESHHVAMGEVESEDDRNKVGGLLKFLMEHGIESGITLSTATNFRNDDKCIIRPSMLTKFKRYQLPFIDHFKNTGIEEFRVEIVPGIKTDPTQTVIEQVCADTESYHIVVVPPRNAGWRQLKLDPSNGLNALVTGLKAAWFAKTGQECRLLNLVPQAEQKKRKKHLLAEPKTHDEEAMPNFDVIVTCMLGREGTDWVPADRLHVTYVEGSIGLAVQTLGRIMRRFATKNGKVQKKDIVARYYYPKFPEPEEGMSSSELLNERKNALLFMTQVDDLFFPIALERVEKRSVSDNPTEFTTLRDIMGDAAYIEMKRDFIDQAVDSVVTTLNTDALEAIIDAVLTEHLPSGYWAQGRRVLMNMYARRACVNFASVDVGFIRETDFPGFLEGLSLDQKTLIFHGGDVEHIKRIREIAKTAFDEKLEMLKPYIVDGKLDYKKLPPRLKVFVNQLYRLRRDADWAIGTAAGL